MGSGRDAPKRYRKRKSTPCAEPVNQLSNEEQAGPICDLKRNDHVAVASLTPSQLHLQDGFQQGDYLAIHVVQRCREKQQSADQPANASRAFSASRRRFAWIRN